MTPTALTGKEFESLLIEQFEFYEAMKIGAIGRYGVQASVMVDKTGQRITQLLQSLPDFEGDFFPGKLQGDMQNERDLAHVIFDAKVCSQASFNWSPYRRETRGAKSRQLKHMLKRSRFGAMCMFAFHWNERALKTRTVEAKTILFPVHHDDDYWDRMEGGEIKSLSYEECEARGFLVPWSLNTKRTKKFRPDILPATVELFSEMSSSF